MKTDKRRFNIFDYLWWQGEMLGRRYKRPGRHADGHYMLGLYILALLIVPLIFLCVKLLNTHPLILTAVSVAIVFAGDIRLVRIYRKRGRAVMNHYANRNFYPIAGCLLFLLPLAIICLLMYCLAPGI